MQHPLPNQGFASIFCFALLQARPLGHLAKPRFHYGGVEETNNQFQAILF